MKKIAALLLLLAIAATPAAKLALITSPWAHGDGCIIAEDEYPYTGTKNTMKKTT